jgi:hypothetical protein
MAATARKLVLANTGIVLATAAIVLAAVRL